MSVLPNDRLAGVHMISHSSLGSQHHEVLWDMAMFHARTKEAFEAVAFRSGYCQLLVSWSCGCHELVSSYDRKLVGRIVHLEPTTETANE